ncbi:MAG TPA: hypothetical protein VF290_08300 [Pyrinomonadaceae bacterium]
MANHSSATVRETPHINQTSTPNTIVNALTRRAEAVLNDTSIDARSRAIIRYGLETDDPWLAELVRRADAGEAIAETIDFSQEPTRPSEDDSSEDKIESLTEMICRAGDEAGRKSAAMLVLMATIESATHPKALAKRAKHLAFTRCGEWNVNGIVDAQVAVLEGELLARETV